VFRGTQHHGESHIIEKPNIDKPDNAARRPLDEDLS
jgi:hypothetical protein